jgi:hypothetical protein
MVCLPLSGRPFASTEARRSSSNWRLGRICYSEAAVLTGWLRSFVFCLLFVRRYHKLKALFCADRTMVSLDPV